MTIDKKSVLDIIQKNRPNISASTIKTYISCINNIAKGSKVDIKSPKDFITNFEPIMEFLMTMKPNIRKTKIASLIVYIDDKHNDHSDILDETLDKYRKQMWNDVKVVKKEDESQELTDSQKENFIPWEEVETVYKNLKDETKSLWKIKDLSPRQFSLLQDFVLLSCYVLIQPRRSKDYSDFKIRNFDDKTLKSKDNYMVVPKGRNARFVFNSYKNSKKLGPQEEDIPKELKLIITKWTNINPNDYLIVNNKGTQVHQEGIAKYLNRIFKKNISSSMLRHIWLTHKFGDINLEELTESAGAMGNSDISTILKYVQKDSSKLKKNIEVEEEKV